MGLNDRSYVRRAPWQSGSSGFSTLTPAVKAILIANVVVFLLQICVTRPTTMNDLTSRMPDYYFDAYGDDVAKLRAALVRSSRVRLEALAARFPGIETVVHVCDGTDDVQAQLAALARRVDASALVVGAHRRSALGHLVLGSTTERCLRRCTRPVLVVPE